MQKENDAVKLLRKNLEHYGGLVTKTHGSVFSKGIPDLDVVIGDYHLKLEVKFVKVPGSAKMVPTGIKKLSEVQRHYLAKFREHNPIQEYVRAELITVVAAPAWISLVRVPTNSHVFRDRIIKEQFELPTRGEEETLVDGIFGAKILTYDAWKKKIRVLRRFLEWLDLPKLNIQKMKLYWRVK